MRKGEKGNVRMGEKARTQTPAPISFQEQSDDHIHFQLSKQESNF